MDRFILADDELCLVESVDTIDNMLQQQIGTDTFVRDAAQVFAMNNPKVIAKDRGCRIHELPLHFSPSVEFRLTEHDPQEAEEMRKRIAEVMDQE